MGDKTEQNGNHVYQLAPQREEFIYDLGTVKPGRSCMEKCALSSCILGFVFIIGAIISALLMKPYVQNQIEGNLVLQPDAEAFKHWKDPPVSPVMKIYFFNFTNLEDFLQGHSKPRLQKLGPYAYVQEMHKSNVSFDSSGETVTFSDKKTYFFSPELSVGRETDLIVMPNIPLMGALKKFQSDPFTRSIFLQTLRSFNFGIDKEPFLTVTVSEFLWGYPSLLLGIKTTQDCEVNKVESFMGETFDENWDNWNDEESAEVPAGDPCVLTPQNMSKFGLFKGANGTSINPRTVHTGKNDLRLKGMVVSVGGADRISDWSEEQCNHLDGHDPGTLSTNLNKDEDIGLYFNGICRRVNFRYTKTIQHNGIEAFRYSPAEDTFNTGAETPENRCYCSREPCPPSGVFDLSYGCKENSPVLFSWPNFLFGDPVLRDSVEGLLPPNRERDSFQLDIEPSWGTVLAANARFQMNVMVRREIYDGFSNIQNPVIIPFLILDEGISGPNKFVVSSVQMLLNIGDTVQSMSALGGVLVGLLCMIPEIILWSRYCCCQQENYSVKKV